MSFAERNAAWTGYSREFRQLQSRSGVPRVWSIRVNGRNIVTHWGQLGGAMQEATEIMNGVNIGKSNEKSPEQYALERAREMCRKKDWEGYREFQGDQPMDPPTTTEINFDDLPLNLCFYKPDNTMGKGMEKLANAGKVLYTRKRNGLAYIIARGTEHPRLYSRKMLRQHDDEKGGALTWNDRFPHIIEAAAKIMPENSILLGELVVDRDGQDDMPAVQSYTKSLTMQSLADQAANGRPFFYIWDIAFWGGEDLVKRVPVKERFERINELDYGGAFLPIEVFGVDFLANPEQAVAHAKEMGWEGYVVVDPNGIYGDKAYNFKGKPDRPGSVCAKLKPDYEDDFVAYWDPSKGWGERSTKARNNLGIKSVALFQYNKEGQLIPISQVSSGLSDDQKRDWAVTDRWPQVWKVKYKDRRYMSDGDDTNALDFAAFVEERTDKAPTECINPKL
jgi:hypothetical protein